MLLCVVVAPLAFDVTFSPTIGPGLLSYLGPVADVSSGRTPLVDAASRHGWAVLDVLAVVFAAVPLGYGTLALVVSASAAACAVLTIIIAAIGCRSTVLLVPGGLAAVVVGFLGAAVADSYAPSSGSITLLLPLVATVAVALGVDRRLWRLIGAGVVGLATIWSLPSALLTLAVVVAGARAWPDDTRRAWIRVCMRSAFVAVAVYSLVGLVRSGTFIDPRLLLAVDSVAPSRGEPALTVQDAGLAALSLLVAATFIARRGAVLDPGRPAHAAACRSVATLGALVAGHGLVAGAPVEIAHGAGLAVLLSLLLADVDRGAVGVFLLAAVVVAALALVGGRLSVRWSGSALYAAIPERPLQELHLFREDSGASLRYDLRVLYSRPDVQPAWRQSAELLGRATRRAGRSLVILPADVGVEMFAHRGGAGLVPLGDPEVDDLVAGVARRADSVVSDLRPGDTLLTWRPWLRSRVPGGDGDAQVVLARIRQRFLLAPIARSGESTLAVLRLSR